MSTFSKEQAWKRSSKQDEHAQGGKKQIAAVRHAAVTAVLATPALVSAGTCGCLITLTA